MLPHVDAGMRFVSATKGLENGTLLRMSEVAGERNRKEIRGSFGADVRARSGARGADGAGDLFR